MGLSEKLEISREISWKNHGKVITFYLPGMFSYDGMRGKYPGISITGENCALECDHCGGSLLKAMIPTMTPEKLVEKCIDLADKGNHGVLISGGCDEGGYLPWEKYLDAIKEVKEKTGLYISIHCGLVDDPVALSLKRAGVDQALIDVIGDDETYQKVYHVPFGISRIESSLTSLRKAELSVIPHIVCGIHYGKIKGERRAIEMISRIDVEQVVIVSLMPAKGTPMWGVELPNAEAVAEVVAETIIAIPKARVSIGCARERGNSQLDVLAIDAGVNRMALPSEEAMNRALEYGLEIRYQKTCCSVPIDFSENRW